MPETAPRCAVAALVVLLAGAAAAQEVSLSLEKFDELRLKASPSPTPTPPPPAPWAIESAAIEIDAGEASARVTTRLTVSLFAADWQQISLPPIGRLLATELGTLEGRVAAGHAWVFHVKGVGRHTIRLESVLELKEDEGATRPEHDAAFLLPNAAACTGTVKVGPGVEEVTFAGATASGRGPGGEWQFVGAPGATAEIGLLGKAVVAERKTLPLRFSATSATLATVSRTRTRVRAFVTARVRQGQLDALEVRLPEPYSVVAVKGDPIGGWDVKDGVLVVTPAAPVEGAFNLDIALTADSRTDLPSPLLLVPEAVRTTVLSAVQIDGDGLIELVAAGSGRPPEEREKAELHAEFLAAARYPLLVANPGQPPRWAVTWPEKGEVLAAQVDRLVVDVLVGESGQAAYQCWAEVRNAGATSLTFTMPAGFEMAAATSGGAKVTPGAAPAGLVIPLTASGEVQVVHLGGLLPLRLGERDETLAVPLPALSAPIGRVEFRLALPGGRSYRAKAVEGMGGLDIPEAGGADTGEANQIAQQVSTVAGEATPVGESPFAVPPGFTTLHGRWSALSARPGPIQVESEMLSSKWGWF